MKKSILLIVFAVISIVGLVINTNAQTIYPNYLDGSVYFKLQDTSSITIADYRGVGNPPSYIADLVTKYTITSLIRPFASAGTNKVNKIYRMEFSNIASVNQLIIELKAKTSNDYAEKVPLVNTFAWPPNDPSYGSQWSLSKIGVTTTTYNTYTVATTSNVTVAIVDNEILRSHTDLAPVMVSGIDASTIGTTNSTNTDPPNSNFNHGTHCAGIAAGVTNNNLGIASLNFSNKIKIMPVKISDANGAIKYGYDGITWAANNGAKVISCSWGSAAFSQAEQDAIDYAYNVKGCIIVAAAGNAGDEILKYPASYNRVISVGATDNGDLITSWSTYNTAIDVMAPGKDIFSTLSASTTSYGNLSGTSMACPLVAGLAAMMWSYNPAFTNGTLETCLKNSCTNIYGLNPGYTGKLGSGRINAHEALRCAAGQTIFADFTSNFVRVCPGGTVNFTDLTGGNPTSWSWNFGDPGSGANNTSTLKNPSHVYANAGTYTVILTSTGAGGINNTKTKTAYITVATPSATISGQAATNVCSNSPQQINLQLTGQPPFSVRFSNGVLITGIGSTNTSVIVNVQSGDSPLTIVEMIDGTACIAPALNLTGNATFTFIACCASIVTNGDFATTPATISPATTQYTWAAGGGQGPGKYNVYDVKFGPSPPFNWHIYPNIASRGLGMFYDGFDYAPPAAPNNYTRVWCQAGRSFLANTSYDIQFFTTGNNMSASEPLAYQIRLSPTGGTAPYTWVASPTVVPPFPGTGNDFSNSKWTQTNFNYYNLTAASNMEVCICQVDLNTGQHWSVDVALDDISIRPNIPQTVNAGADVSICIGDGIAVGAPSVAGINYSWSPATGLSSTTVGNPTASPTVTTTYTLTATNPTTGCTSRDEVVVTVRTTCCTGAWNAPSTISANTTISNPTYANASINQNLTITAGTLTFNNITVLVGTNVTITVNSGATLSLTGGAYLRACSQMWNGIVVQQGGNLLVNGSTIEDAKIAIESVNGAYFITNNGTKLNKNRIGIQLDAITWTHPGWVYNTTISCYDPSGTATNALIAPYAGQKSFRGINIVSVTQAQIGLDQVGQGNTIDNQQTGIYNSNSGLTVYNTSFKNITASTSASWAIRSLGNATTGRTINVGGTANAYQKNTFKNSTRGVSVNTNHTVNVTGNDFDNLTTGVEVYYCNYSINSISVNTNTINDCETGIYAYDAVNASGSWFNASGNFINIPSPGPNSKPNSTGIKVANSVIGSNGGFHPNYSIINNVIKRVANGIWVTNLLNFNIYDNNISNISDLGGGVMQNGILAEGSIGYGNYAMRNNVVQNTDLYALYDWYQSGIRLETTVSTVLYNTVQNIGRGLFIGGNCTGTETAINHMIDNTDGFFLNWAQLGNQLPGGKATENTWAGTMLTSHVNCWNTDGSNITMNLQNGASTCPSPFLNLPVTPIGISKKINATCGNFLPSGYKTSDPKKDLYLRITKDKVTYSPTYAVTTKWIDKYNVYRNLMQDDSLMKAGDADLKAFADSVSLKNMGKLYGIGKELGSINAVNASAIAAISILTPENLIEQNLKDIYSIVVSLRTNNGLSKTEIQILKTIAQQCAYEGGYGVYSARVLLSTVDSTVYVDNCDGKPKSALKLSPADSSENSVIATVYPNPANDKLTVALHLGEGQNGQLTIYDLSGRLVISNTLNAGNITEISTNTLSEGLYIYKVIVNNVALNTGKLSIIH